MKLRKRPASIEEGYIVGLSVAYKEAARRAEWLIRQAEILRFDMERMAEAMDCGAKDWPRGRGLPFQFPWTKDSVQPPKRGRKP